MVNCRTGSDEDEEDCRVNYILLFLLLIILLIKLLPRLLTKLMLLLLFHIYSRSMYTDEIKGYLR